MRWVPMLALCVGCGRIGFGTIGVPADVAHGSNNVFAVVAHVNSSCAIIAGALSCWGDNARGQLLTGDTNDGFKPVRIGSDGDWIAVAPGQDHICGLREGGALYCWGGNDKGQLGLGDFADRTAVTRVLFLRPVIAIDGYFHTCALLENGELWCWGANSEGELGQNDALGAPNIPSPARVAPALSWTRVSTGQGHTLATAAGDGLYGTGRNSHAELGLGPAGPAQERVMTSIDAGPWAAIAAGEIHSCAMRTGGTIACWGFNADAELGTSDRTDRNLPTAIGAASFWQSIDTDTFHGCALATNNTIWCWGRNTEGELGVGDSSDRLAPSQSGSFTDWAMVSVGRFHTCAMRADHSVWCTGANSNAQLGIAGPGLVTSWIEVAM